MPGAVKILIPKHRRSRRALVCPKAEKIFLKVAKSKMLFFLMGHCNHFHTMHTMITNNETKKRPQAGHSKVAAFPQSALALRLPPTCVSANWRHLLVALCHRTFLFTSREVLSA